MVVDYLQMLKQLPAGICFNIGFTIQLPYQCLALPLYDIY